MREKKKLDACLSGSPKLRVRKLVLYGTIAFLTPYLAPLVLSGNLPPHIEEINTHAGTECESVVLDDTDCVY